MSKFEIPTNQTCGKSKKTTHKIKMDENYVVFGEMIEIWEIRVLEKREKLMNEVRDKLGLKRWVDWMKDDEV